MVGENTKTMEDGRRTTQKKKKKKKTRRSRVVDGRRSTDDRRRTTDDAEAEKAFCGRNDCSAQGSHCYRQESVQETREGIGIKKNERIYKKW